MSTHLRFVYLPLLWLTALGCSKQRPEDSPATPREEPSLAKNSDRVELEQPNPMLSDRSQELVLEVVETNDLSGDLKTPVPVDIRPIDEIFEPKIVADPEIPFPIPAEGPNLPPGLDREQEPFPQPFPPDRPSGDNPAPRRRFDKISSSASTEYLLEVLRAGDRFEKMRAIEALGYQGPKAKRAVPALMEVLRSGDSFNASGAALSLLNIEPGTKKEIIDILVAQLRSDNVESASAAGNTLGNLGPAGKTAVAAIIQRLKESKDDRIRNSCAYALGGIGPDAKEGVPLLQALLKDKHPMHRLQAVYSLGRMGPAAHEATPEILKLIEDTTLLEFPPERKTIGAHAAETLPSIVTEVELPLLRKRVQDADPQVQLAVIESLSRLGPKAKEAVSQLEEIMKGDAVRQSLGAARAILVIKGESKEALDVVMKILKGRVQAEKLMALRILREVGVAAKPFIPVLVEIVEKSKLPNDKDVQESSVEMEREADLVHLSFSILGKIGPDAVPALTNLLGHTHSRIRNQAIYALGKMGDKAKLAVEKLIERLEDSNEDNQRLALQSLARMGDGGVKALMEATRHKHPLVRGTALLVLALPGGDLRAVLPNLVRGLKDENPRVQATSVVALRARAAQVVPLLMADLEGKNVAETVDAANVFRRLAGDAKVALPKLKSLLVHEDPAVRRSAAGAIHRIDSEVAVPVPALVSALSDTDFEIYSWAARTLESGIAKHSDVPLLAEVVRGTDGAARYAALAALEKLGSDAREAVPDLITALKKPAAWRKDPPAPKGGGSQPFYLLDDPFQEKPRSLEPQEMISEMVETHPFDRDPYGGFGGSMSGRSGSSRFRDKPQPFSRSPLVISGSRAAQVLGKIGEPAVASLMKATTDEDTKMRAEAIYALSIIGPLAKDALPVLEERLSDKEAAVRFNAVVAISKIDAKGAISVKPLIKALQDTDSKVLLATVAALRVYGPSAKEAAQALLEVMNRKKDEDLMSWTFDAIHRIDPMSAQPVADLLLTNYKKAASTANRNQILWKQIQLYPTLAVYAVPLVLDNSSSPNPREFQEGRTLLRDLIALNNDSIVPLARGLTHAKPEIRREVAALLVSLRGAAVPPLIVGLKADNPADRAASARGLGELGNLARSASPDLRKLKEDKDDNVRKAVDEAIRKIGPSSDAIKP